VGVLLFLKHCLAKNKKGRTPTGVSCSNSF
jgi:hypothetical protein